MTTNKKSIAIYSSLLLAIVVYWLSSVIHLEKVKRNSEFVFTIAEISDFYHQGITNGKEITYFINNKKFVNHCGSMQCKRTKIGERYLIKVFNDDPEVYEIIYTIKVKPVIVAPIDGWKSIPMLQN
jgi:hypothetical protein